jgi:hypothetical protein
MNKAPAEALEELIILSGMYRVQLGLVAKLSGAILANDKHRAKKLWGEMTEIKSYLCDVFTCDIEEYLYLDV